MSNLINNIIPTFKRANQLAAPFFSTAPSSVTVLDAAWLNMTYIATPGPNDANLPDATTLPLGWQVTFNNVGSQRIHAKLNNGLTTIQEIDPAECYTFTCIDNSTTNGVWFVENKVAPPAPPTSAVVVATGVINNVNSSLGPTTMVGPITADGVYRLSFYLEDTTAGISGSLVSASVGYTSSNGNVQNKTIISNLALTTLGNEADSTTIIDAQSGTSISYSTNFVNGVGSPIYAVRYALEQLF